jgi:ParB family transcriptional regulator, chromosome partitioning protein
MTTPVLEHLDPATLLIDTNVRSDLGLDTDFCASVKTSGVIVPIVAERTPDGIRVRAGHRRTAAAVQAGLPTVPVMVIDGGDAAGRIIDQLIENIHRAPLTTADTVGAVEQLALLGCSAAQITRRTRIPRPHVDQALLVSEATSTRTAITDPEQGLTLEMAAWLAEFEDDPKTWEHLRQSFRDFPGSARHTVERALRRRDEQAALTTAEAQLTAQGWTRYQGDIWEDKKAKMLADLVTPGGKKLTIEGHQDCPGHAYDLTTYAGSGLNTEFEEGNVTVYARWLCTDYVAHGHRDRHKAAGGTPDPSPEDQSEARRKTIALNKAGEAALTVRREWLTAFTQARTAPPADWTVFMLHSLDTNHCAAEDRHNGWAKVRTLVRDDIPGLADPTRAARLLLCARLWTYENNATKSIWRQTSTHRLYLDYLSQWGYQLSDVEKCGAGHINQDLAYKAVSEQ